ncbi:MAG: right-handed parallel beta-helix repeat-containing protein [Crocosphaera sp.]|nr:right-handed parallel beta-helix repeat-containing protein [Crocosphaera sp.]
MLTASQLNNVTDYLNDQTRLTRIYLLGVGVIAGLRVSLLSGDVIKVSPGIGITSDGDLLSYSNKTVISVTSDGDPLYFSNETVFDRFLEYDQFYPKYAPFYVNGDTAGEMNPVYELIPQDADDQRSSIFSLNEFTTQTGKQLEDMVAVLLMESYENDPDICTATDCDNLGKDCINRIKLLLVDNINLLKPEIATPSEAYGKLQKIVADRPIIPQSIRSYSHLFEIYLKVCTTIHDKLRTELVNLSPHFQSFLSDVFPSDPTNTWITQLTKILSFFDPLAIDRIDIQYYYDFLKDVVETYNQFRELLFGDTTWCCPDINWFPKHLLLGNLDPTSNPDENRTAFYPSPAVSRTEESLNHAKFLLRKIDTLIKTFEVPYPSNGEMIRITPSLFEDQPLEARAIPYYYQVNQTHSIHKNWNYNLHQRGMDSDNYSYNASLYNAKGGAAKPLESQLGHFSFFRIEGHLHQDSQTAFKAISGLIKAYNLPFSVLLATLGQPSYPGVANFIDLLSQQPSIEHFGGVVRGGTFVLLTDETTVIADFMLPYLLNQRSSSICSLLVKPSDNLASVLGIIGNGEDAHICFEQGTYTLNSPLVLNNKGHLTITGSGKGTRIIAPGMETVIEFSNCKSVSMSNCYLENSASSGTVPPGFAKNSQDIRGVLTFINCPSVELEKLSLRSAHQVVRSASCVTVRQALSVPQTQVRIRNCDLQVGYQQIGILLINVERSQIEGNQIEAWGDSLHTKEILLKIPEYHLRLLPRLIANAYLGTKKPRGGATSQRFDQCNVRLEFSGQSIRFKSDLESRDWTELVTAQNRFVRSRQDLLKAVKQLARRILLEKEFRVSQSAFDDWYQRITKISECRIASQGITVAGYRADEVRILNNTIRDCLQGIHIGISPRSSHKAGSILLTGNHITVLAPIDQVRERHGVYVSSCDSLIVENNYLQCLKNTRDRTMEGIRISGRLGPLVIIRQNYLTGFNPYGIYFNPLDAYGAEKKQWLVADNIATNTSTFMKVVSNRPGEEGEQIVGKVRDSNNFQ